MDFGQIAGAVAGEVTLRVSSRFSPPVAVSLGAGAGESAGGDGGVFMAFLQPKVEVMLGGSVVGTYAPGGTPDAPDTWLPLVFIGLGALAAVGLAAWGVTAALRSL